MALVNGTFQGTTAPFAWIICGGWGSFDNVLLEVVNVPAVTGIWTSGDYTISRLWSEMTAGAATLIADGARARVRLMEPALLSYNKIEARNGAKVKVETPNSLPAAMFVGDVTVTAPLTAD